jgi:hypothetical protein
LDRCHRLIDLLGVQRIAFAKAHEVADLDVADAAGEHLRPAHRRPDHHRRTREERCGRPVPDQQMTVPGLGLQRLLDGGGERGRLDGAVEGALP